MLRYFDQCIFCMIHSIGQINECTNFEINRYKTCTNRMFYLITSHGDSSTSCLLCVTPFRESRHVFEDHLVNLARVRGKQVVLPVVSQLISNNAHTSSVISQLFLCHCSFPII